MNSRVGLPLAGNDIHTPTRNHTLLQTGWWDRPGACPRPEQIITRSEFVGGCFLCSAEAGTVGGFELFPASACVIGRGLSGR
jgi:hypothetical protein